MLPNSGGPPSLIGSHILNLITTGMYDNPLAIYREYIQNAADAIASSSHPTAGRVHVTIDPASRRITIRDSGPGLSHSEAIRELLPIGRSLKQHGTHRGFRGIGRLSGLAFADAVTFRTRATSSQPVTRVLWNATALRGRQIHAEQADATIRHCVEVSKQNEDGFPDHFFEVEIHNVARHAAGVLLNREAVRTYISEVCPVPMAHDFPYTSPINELFSRNDRPLTLQIVLAECDTPIARQHCCSLQFTQDREDPYSEFEPLCVPTADGDSEAAVGWLAHTSYLGAIPKELGVRGVRARIGNIQIGDEHIFDTLFPEDRFNRWCIGEIHVIDSRILPNCRRDYFEPGPHTRNLENHLEAIFRRIANRCRKASAARRHTRSLLATLHQMESAYDLASSGYLTARDSRGLVQKTLQQAISMQRERTPGQSFSNDDATRLNDLEVKLNAFRPKRTCPQMTGVRRSDVAAYRRVFQAISHLSPSPSAAKKLIEDVLSYT